MAFHFVSWFCPLCFCEAADTGWGRQWCLRLCRSKWQFSHLASDTSAPCGLWLKCEPENKQKQWKGDCGKHLLYIHVLCPVNSKLLWWVICLKPITATVLANSLPPPPHTHTFLYYFSWLRCCVCMRVHAYLRVCMKMHVHVCVLHACMCNMCVM